MTIGLFRMISRLWPSDFRAEFGPSMEDTFSQRLTRARRGGSRRWSHVLLRELLSALWLALSLRRRTAPTGQRGSGHRPPVLDGFRHDLGYALRTIRRRPGFSALALVTPFHVAPQLLRFDVWVMAGTAFVLLPVMFTGWRIGRREGAAFLLAYAVYVALQYGAAG